ncbi:MAG: hypothetical protein IPN95_02245 [Bacteroidetes bacterium]|nr:hypothetical protein [Bacteroidota bacterium]
MDGAKPSSEKGRVSRHWFWVELQSNQNMIKIGLNDDFGYVWARQSHIPIDDFGRLLEKNCLQSTCKKKAKETCLQSGEKNHLIT